MPIYEYRCTYCGTTRELIVPNSDATPPDCKLCGAPMEKQHSVSNFKIQHVVGLGDPQHR